MKRIEIRGIIVPSAYDSEWLAGYIDKGLFTPESRFRKALADAGEDVEIYVNSRGGSVFAGNEMLNAVKAFKASGRKVEITVGAMAASMAANIVAMAGADRVRAHANSKFMFHGAQTLTEGGNGAHKDSAGLLAALNADVIAELKKKMPKCDAIDGWFAEGRMGWLSAQQAKQLGLVDEIIGSDAEALAAMDKEASQKMLDDGLDVAAFDFQEPTETVSKADFDALMARFTGLQSAKDKEIATIKADFDAFKETSAENLTGQLATKDTQISALTAERDDFKAKLATADADLGKVKADLSAEVGAHAKTKSDLDETVKQRDEAKANHLALVGKVLGGDPEGKKTGEEKTGLARMVAAEKAETESKKGA